MPTIRSPRATLTALLVAVLPTAHSAACELAEPPEHAWTGHGALVGQALISESLGRPTACRRGFADIYPCDEVDLLAHLPLIQLQARRGNDIWGWSHRGREYALVGLDNGTAFVEITDPENPIYLGKLPTQTITSVWRDIKVYRNRAYVVADSAGAHGLQVFDLTRLLDVSNPPVDFTPDALYSEFGSAHNVAINEESGFAYVVGSDVCSGGLHMVNIRKPEKPKRAGCFSEDGDTHDVQCVIYHGPDRRYAGDEICFASNEDTLTVVDVTDKRAPVMLSRNTYEGSAYTHQGWLTEDHAYFLLDDEGDELQFGHNAKTYVFDTSDLTALRLKGTHVSSRPAVDHNQYVAGNYTYQANYQQGLAILEIADPAAGRLEEVAFFDTYPESNGLGSGGAWSVYPFFKSGTVVVSDINRGLFVLRPRLSSVLFSDGFESGSLSAWSRVNGPGVAVRSPGLGKSAFALAVTVDGTGAVSELVALEPDREASLEASFLLKPNGVDLGGQEVEILRFLGRRNSTVVSLALGQRGSKYLLTLSAESDGELEIVGSATISPRRITPLRLQWRRASDGGADDGVVRLIKKRKVRIESTTLETTTAIDAVSLGLPSGSAGAKGGSFLVDDFDVSR